MGVNLDLPEQLSILGVNCIQIRLAISKIGHVAIFPASSHGDCGSYSCLGAIDPNGASGLGAESVDSAVTGTEKHAPRNDSRLRVCGAGVWNSEGPFQFQARNRIGVDGRVRLIAGIENICAPAVPGVRTLQVARSDRSRRKARI